MKLPLFHFFVVTIYYYSSVKGLRGVGEAMPRQFPFLASVQFKNFHKCSGFVQSAYRIVTSANCVYGKKLDDITVTLGQVDILDPTDDKTTVSVKRIYYNEPRSTNKQLSNWKNWKNWKNPKSWENWLFSAIPDLAILDLCEPLNLTGYGIQSIKIAMLNKTASNWKGMGWGDIIDPSQKAQTLRYGYLNVVDNESCEKLFGFDLLPPDRICCEEASPPPRGSYGANPCILDSGSPLIQGNGRNQKVVGIATIISGCSAGDLAIFLRLSSFMEDLSETKYWNDSYIPSAASCPEPDSSEPEEK